MHFSGVSALRASCVGPGVKAGTMFRAAVLVAEGDCGQQLHLKPDELASVPMWKSTIDGASSSSSSARGLRLPLQTAGGTAGAAGGGASSSRHLFLLLRTARGTAGAAVGTAGAAGESAEELGEGREAARLAGEAARPAGEAAGCIGAAVVEAAAGGASSPRRLFLLRKAGGTAGESAELPGAAGESAEVPGVAEEAVWLAGEAARLAGEAVQCMGEAVVEAGGEAWGMGSSTSLLLGLGDMRGACDLQGVDVHLCLTRPPRGLLRHRALSLLSSLSLDDGGCIYSLSASLSYII